MAANRKQRTEKTELPGQCRRLSDVPSRGLRATRYRFFDRTNPRTGGKVSERQISNRHRDACFFFARIEELQSKYKPLFTDDGDSGPLKKHAQSFGWVAIVADLARSGETGFGLSKLTDVYEAPTGAVFTELMRRKALNRVLSAERAKQEARQKSKHR